MLLPLTVSNEITSYFSEHIDQNPQDYVCVYGSSVYSSEKRTSDVDLFVVTHTLDSLALSSLIDFVKDLHIRHGRILDAEVPYENKMHYTAQELEHATEFGGFQITGKEILVPPVRKEPSFLRSSEIKARLALNGLTTPHAALGKDFSKYHLARDRASETITLLAINLFHEDEFGVNDLHDALSVEQNTGMSGELFLGYKTEYPIVSEHLKGTLGGALDRLAINGVIFSTSEGYGVKRNEFDPLGYMKATKQPL